MPLPGFLKRKLRQTVVIAGMGGDSGGRAVLSNGRLAIDYDPGQSAIYNDIRRAAAIVAAELGGTLSGGDKPTTAHPMGGAAIGGDENSGVIDRNGEVFGHPGLFVTDAAALPVAVGGPPSLTIGAWAEHVAERFIARCAPLPKDNGES